MEWVLVLIGIAYSIWSTYRKEAKENEQKRQQGNFQQGNPQGGPRRSIQHGPQRNPQRTPQSNRESRAATAREAADHVFAHRSTRQTLDSIIPAMNPKMGPQSDPNEVREIGVEDMQESFTSRLNRRIMSQDVEGDIRRTLAEVFGDTNQIETLRPETERYKDYDKLSSYDDQARSSFSREHDYTSHFKLNEGLRKDSFKVGTQSGFDDANDAYEKKGEARKLITLDKGSLKSYYIMHEILSKPKSLEALEQRRHIARRDARHPH